MSDADLVRLVLDGNTGAYADLIRRHGRGLFAFCKAHVWSEAAAEELSQEALTRGLENLAHLAQPDQFRPWVFGIARNLCSHWQHDRDNKNVPLSRLGTAPNGPNVGRECPGLQAVDRDDSRRRLLELVAALPERARRAVTLRYMDDLSYAQIAERLDCCEATVGNLLREARELLRDGLGPDMSF
jgi:RNA polymerase sigma-70 factor (ECF subfamily)